MKLNDARNTSPKVYINKMCHYVVAMTLNKVKSPQFVEIIADRMAAVLTKENIHDDQNFIMKSVVGLGFLGLQIDWSAPRPSFD